MDHSAPIDPARGRVTEPDAGGWGESLVGLLPEEIAALPALSGLPAYRSRQIAAWIYRKGAATIEEMSTLPRALRSRLAAEHSLSRLPLRDLRISADGSAQKFLFSAGGSGVESVLIRSPRRDTICVSTQAGCAFGCRFCATAAMGWQRDLTRHELVAQVLELRDELRRLGAEGFFNVVFMGMGEPLANFSVLTGALRVLHDDHGLGIGRRRMTVSTVGLPERIRALARAPVTVRLALSLNATENATRSRLMPINRRHPIESLLPAMAEYRELTGQRTTLEYILLHEVNDTIEDARRLARLAHAAGCGVNLILYNEHPLSDLRPSSAARAEAFQRELLPIAPAVTVRDSRGGDILAACGQLSTAYPAGAAGEPSPGH